MRKCSLFHWRDLEKGDTIEWSIEDRENDYKVETLTGVVSRIYNTNNFGPVITLSSINDEAVEHPENLLYLNDVETIRFVGTD